MEKMKEITIITKLVGNFLLDLMDAEKNALDEKIKENVKNNIIGYSFLQIILTEKETINYYIKQLKKSKKYIEKEINFLEKIESTEILIKHLNNYSTSITKMLNKLNNYINLVNLYNLKVSAIETDDNYNISCCAKNKNIIVQFSETQIKK